MVDTANTRTKREQDDAADEHTRPGALMAIGGAEDKLDDMVILSRFVRMAGGKKARVVIVPTASSFEDAGLRYKAIFLGMGVEEAEVTFLQSRDDANDSEHIDALEDATGIFLTGGNQVKLSVMIGGTQFEETVRRKHRSGTVIAGTSAGASILSAHMVAGGAGGAVPKQRMAQMVAGFGLISNVIIDQHFRQRNRIGRLLALVATNPRLLGVGIDEDTAAIFHDGRLEVIGRHSVTVVDGSEMYTDIFRVKGHGEVTVSNARLHVLPAGRTFDLESRTLSEDL
ncbi:MAG TPA: cyanophycinase [Thermomicrobiales bacterium]|nr:cyanophycinase [Thermomicrobiales bacterium]